jgi:hypothetical protein
MRTALVVAAALVLSACGSSICARIEQQGTRILGTKERCEYTEAGVTFMVSIGQATASECESKCTSADQAVVADWLRCIEGAPACTTGSEKASVDAVLRCGSKLVDGTTGAPKLSAGCLQGF